MCIILSIKSQIGSFVLSHIYIQNFRDYKYDILNHSSSQIIFICHSTFSSKINSTQYHFHIFIENQYFPFLSIKSSAYLTRSKSYQFNSIYQIQLTSQSYHAKQYKNATSKEVIKLQTHKPITPSYSSMNFVFSFSFEDSRSTLTTN